ncbi:Replicase polyprotein 1a [Bienertia sinuspersici]
MAVGSLRHQHPKGNFNLFSFRVVCRSVSNHPFLLAVLLFLICLHRYFPFLFSLLVTASPVLICTAIVLGTLLIHGQPNNNVRYHEDVINPGATLRTGVEEYHPYSADREGIFSKDRSAEVRNDRAVKGMRASGMSGSGIRVDGNVTNYEEVINTGATPRTGVKEYHPYSADREGIFSKGRFAEVRNDIVEKGMRASGMLGSEIRADGDVTKEVDWQYSDVELSKGSKIHEEKRKSDFDFANFEEANVQMCMDRDYGKTIKVNQDIGMPNNSESSLGQQNADVTGNHEYETYNLESSDCESDVADKSSFDALVADVIPTAQETFPLLDSEDPLHRDASHDASRNIKMQSLDSNHSSDDSAGDQNDNHGDVDVDEDLKGNDNEDKYANAWVDMEKNQQLESLLNRSDDERDDEQEEVEDDESIEDIEDDDDDDDEEQENKTLEKDVRTNQVTMWTEEDEKNMRLVGNSELERDLRLENLLARRRAKRNFSMISERNLIDLDRPVTPFQVTPVSTTRVNPFETLMDTKQQHCSTPPVPGSAPPVRVARKNPFDSPCTSPKGIQNLTEDQFHNVESMEVDSNNAVHEDSSSRGYNSMKNDFKPGLEMNRKDAVFRRYEKHVVGDQEERHSSSSHDSESMVSSSESDHTEFLTKDEDAGPSKDTTAEDQMYPKADSAHGDNASSNNTSEDDHCFEKDEDEIVSESGFSPKASSNGAIEPPVYDASPTGTEKSTPFSSTNSE